VTYIVLAKGFDLVLGIAGEKGRSEVIASSLISAEEETKL
jgi:hypothetical protein